MRVYAMRILTDVYGRTVQLSDERGQHTLRIKRGLILWVKS